MTDYYPLIAKAVASLENAQDRRTLYERGRNALMDELKAVDPPLHQSIIAREQLAFEDAIRKIEAEVARRAKIELPPSVVMPSPPGPPMTLGNMRELDVHFARGKMRDVTREQRLSIFARRGRPKSANERT